MGCNSRELLRWLPSALGDLYPLTSIEIDQEKLQEQEEPHLRLIAITGKPHQIALLKIPTLEVQFLFPRQLYDLSSIDPVMAKFDLYTRRGGG